MRQAPAAPEPSHEHVHYWSDGLSVSRSISTLDELVTDFTDVAHVWMHGHQIRCGQTGGVESCGS